MIERERRGEVRTIQLARPEARNALTSEALSGLERAVETAGAESSVIEIRGVGPAFCAGADLDEVAGLDAESAREFAELGQRVARAIEEVPAVVVAAIDGPARGGGLELALSCDVRVATPRSTFGEPGVAFGLFGAWGGTVRLPELVGPGVARDLAFSGRVVDADEALRTGLVSRVVDDPATVAKEIAANDEEALLALKRLLGARGNARERETKEASAFGALVETHAGELNAVLE